MIRALTFALVGLAIVVLPNALFGQARRYPLITTDGLRLHNTAAAAVTFKGKRAVRMAVAPEVARRPEYLAGQSSRRHSLASRASSSRTASSKWRLPARRRRGRTPARGASSASRSSCKPTAYSAPLPTYDAF